MDASCWANPSLLTYGGREEMAAIFKWILENENAWNFDKNFIEICFYGSNSQLTSIRSDNGFAPTRLQAIIWNNNGLDSRRIYASLGPSELI